MTSLLWVMTAGSGRPHTLWTCQMISGMLKLAMQLPVSCQAKARGLYPHAWCGTEQTQYSHKGNMCGSTSRAPTEVAQETKHNTLVYTATNSIYVFCKLSLITQKQVIHSRLGVLCKSVKYKPVQKIKWIPEWLPRVANGKDYDSTVSCHSVMVYISAEIIRNSLSGSTKEQLH